MAFLAAILGGRWGRRAGHWWGAAVFACCVLRAPAADTPPVFPPVEYQVKAVFLFNFAQFAEWPARAFPDAHAPLVIGILGEDPFGPYLDELVKNEKVGERPLTIRRCRGIKEVAGCHIIFISRSETARLERIIPALKGQSVLTVGDADTFTRHGGMVRLVTEGGKIRLRINVEAAKACGLAISSKIIRPATIVTSEKD